MNTAPQFTFHFYRFIGTNGSRTTEVVRDYTQADGMRSLVDRNAKFIELATERAAEWAFPKE